MDIEYYKERLVLNGLLDLKTVQTLKVAKYTEECQFCHQKLQLSTLNCNHKICTDCLDGLVDSHQEMCPLCHTTIISFVYS